MSLEQTIKAIIIFISVVTRSEITVQDIECYNEIGWFISTDHGLQSKATCPAPYSLVSCTAIPTNRMNFLGTFIQNNECMAFAKHSTTYPSAYFQTIARCCNFVDAGASVKYYYSGPSSSTIDGDEAIISCQSTQEVLIGCTGYDDAQDYSVAGWGYFDGYYTEAENECTAENGALGSGPSYANAVCIDTANMNPGYEMQCVSYWGPQSNEAGDQSTVTCDDGWVMTSCGAKGIWSKFDSIYIEQDTCIMLRQTANAKPDEYARANGICCQVTKATNDPTISSSYPSKSPSNYPSSYPSQSPSDYPNHPITQHPSPSPTVKPNPSPMVKPTPSPTVKLTPSPTVKLTPSPTVKPTPSPLEQPSFSSTETVAVGIVITAAPASDQAENTREQTQATEEDGYSETTPITDADGLQIVVYLLISIFVCYALICVAYLWRRYGGETGDPQNEMVSIQASPAPNVVQINSAQQSAVNPSERDLVIVWLRYAVQLPQYSEVLLREGYDTMRAIQAIQSREELRALGITCAGHQTLILHEIKALRGTTEDGATLPPLPKEIIVCGGQKRSDSDDLFRVMDRIPTRTTNSPHPTRTTNSPHPTRTTDTSGPQMQAIMQPPPLLPFTVEGEF